MTDEYVAAAYGVILFGLLMYVVVVGLRSARMARQAELLALLVERDDEEDRRHARAVEPGAPTPAPDAAGRG